ncbi:MAG: hypothetical protein ACOCXG_00525 [Nanoarchaeota archaeon]
MIKIKNLVFVFLAVLLVFVSGCSSQDETGSQIDAVETSDGDSTTQSNDVAEVIEEDLIDSEDDDVEIGSLI